MKQELIHVTVDNSANLPGEVDRLMGEAGLPVPDFWRRYIKGADVNALGTWEEQQFIINNALRDWLIDVGEERELDTRVPRCCLLPTRDKGEWLKLIEKGVAPWIANTVLPLARS